MTRSVLVGVLVLAGCGEPEGPEVTVMAPAARWMAVRTAEEPTWHRVDGEVTRIKTDGDFEVMVVCREDIGDGWTWLATPDDIEPNDEGVRELVRYCQNPGGATVVFDVVGEVGAIYIGNSPAYGPTLFSAEVEPGVHDIVAVRDLPEVGAGSDRVQILRGVNIVPGMNRIAIDVEAMGQPVVDATVEVNGARPWFAYHDGYTAGGTWFRIQRPFGVGAMDGDLRVLPAALRVAGDLERAHAELEDSRWLTSDIHEGVNALTIDAPAVEGTFLIGGTTMQVTWPASEDYDRMSLGAYQIVNGEVSYPMWTLYAYQGALARRTSAGVTTVTMSAPDLADFQQGWLTNFDQAYGRAASWWRAREGGIEGFRDSARISP